MRLRSLLPVVFCCALFACKEKQNSASTEEKATTGQEPPQKTGDTTETYFSITDYFNDQWKNRNGDPYTLLKIVETNGRRDSAYVPLDGVLWGRLRAYFDAADISDKKYLGWYKFDMFTDETTETTHLHYEAVAADLFLRKMDISADMVTNLVKSIYMETSRQQDGRLVRQKLQYMPDRIFQIQILGSEKGNITKDTLLEYRFKY
ncbi:hypothetical protein [Taibaiella koreensis]|uniref:hypothetical protein n=1 Tax=Taibaiella koreensis TaxID=1268548 RepID=UPI0013C30FA3|nr:hypothetical protein [Taibaiella koreensis]